MRNSKPSTSSKFNYSRGFCILDLDITVWCLEFGFWILAEQIVTHLLTAGDDSREKRVDVSYLKKEGQRDAAPPFCPLFASIAGLTNLPAASPGN
jgi:hypothetical protein